MVMNSKNKVFGVVESAEENKDYTGVKTDTAEVTVNNVTREIKVDVDFYSMLGETNKTAYPGHEGKLNRVLILTAEEDIRKETVRAKEAEESLTQLIQDVSWDIDVGDSIVVSKVYAETDRAKAAEAKLQEDIARLDTKIDDNSIKTTSRLEKLSADLNKKIEDTDSRLQESDTEILKKLNLIDRSYKSADKSIQESISNIEENYAEKSYVYEQLIEFNKLHKQIADSIDLDNNTVVIEGVSQPAQGNVIYLVKQIINEEEIYSQYTIINDKLTFIGSSKIDLSDYATKTYVDNKVQAIDLSPYATTEFVTEQIEAIPEVDLTDYAKLSDIPDVSEFINEIPPEYITETELDEKQFLTRETADSDFATKVYVQTELSKIGSLDKEIVDSVDLNKNMIVINNTLLHPQENIIYLVKNAEFETYDQYTLINGVLKFIGSTDVNLDGYATVEYVDSNIAQALSFFETTLKNIEFIDGGKAPL